MVATLTHKLLFALRRLPSFLRRVLKGHGGSLTDSRLQEFWRRWRETGSAEDEARWLQERLRVGELDPTLLEIAARCGSLAAIASVGSRPPLAPLEVGEALARLLPAERSELILVKWQVSLSEKALAVFEREFPQDTRPRKSLATVAQWLCRQASDVDCLLAAEAAELAATECNSEWQRLGPIRRLLHSLFTGVPRSATSHAALAVQSCALSAAHSGNPASQFWAMSTIRHAHDSGSVSNDEAIGLLARLVLE